MALNWAMLTASNTLVPLPGEENIVDIETGAELTLFVPDTPPSASSTSGGSGGTKKLKETGGLWLTDKRLVFATPSGPGSGSGSFTSLSVPLDSVLATRFEQPYLAANYLAFEIRPVPDGGLPPGTRAELRIKDRPMFQFVSTLEKVRERSLYMRRQSLDEDEGPPMYTSPAAESSVSYFVMATPADQPPMYDDGGPSSSRQ